MNIVTQKVPTEPSKLFISVAIATFNGEGLIEQLICSIASQSMRPNEVIISDDCSSDDTVITAIKILRQCKLNFKVIKNKERLGFENNFVRAMRLCQGDLIFLADQDDLWLPNKVARIYETALSMPGIDVFLHDAYVCDDKLWITHESLFDSVRSSFKQFAYGFCMVVRQRIVTLFPAKSIPIGHDLIINSFANCLDTKYYLYDKLALYRRHVNAFTFDCAQKKQSLYKKYLYFDVASHTKSALASAIVSSMLHNALSNSYRYSVCYNIAISKVDKSIVQSSARLAYMKKHYYGRIASIVISLITGKISLFSALKDSISHISEH